MDSRFDVVITGGGLAGLTLARQLHLDAPDLAVLVCEKLQHPIPEAAFKVGESSVEIGANYWARVLGLGALLDRDHLPKFGLRYFFPHRGNHDIAARTELGPTAFSPVPSFQVDRGRFENALLTLARADGACVLDGSRVRDIRLGQGAHEVDVAVDGVVRTVTARWVVDASGRAGLLKRRLGLARSVTHAANACWFRVPVALKVDDWSSDPGWRARVPDQCRWLSTNHLMGAGYWVWLIPLGSGSTSVGIVADPALHPFHRLSRFDRALEWLQEFEPQCAAAVVRHARDLQDFRVLQHFAHGCSRVFSADRWAMVGESGVFTDPFYSPGSDFIAMGNDFVADLIVRDRRGENITARAETFNTTYLRLFDAFLRLYDGQYPLMGNAPVMIAKIAWDNAAYWSITALLFFQRRLRQPEFMASIEPLLLRFFVLHARMQQLFAAWGRSAAPSPDEGGRYANVMDVPRLRKLQGSVLDPLMDDDALRRRLERNYAALAATAQAWQHTAAEHDPALGRFVPRDPAAGEDQGGCIDLLALTGLQTTS